MVEAVKRAGDRLDQASLSDKACFYGLRPIVREHGIDLGRDESGRQIVDSG